MNMDISVSGSPWAARFIVIIVVLVLASGLTLTGHDLATACLLSLAVIGGAADLARRLSGGAREVSA